MFKIATLRHIACLSPIFMKNLPVSNPYFCNLCPFEELATVLKVFLAYTLILAQYVNEAEIC